MKRKIYFILIIIMIFSTVNLNYSYGNADFGGGEGTEENPYQIATAQHLNNIRNYLQSNLYFILTSDIYLDESPWSDGDGWTPIGDTHTNGPFIGSFDGDNYAIIGLKISRPAEDNVALFGYVEDAIFKNINLSHCNIIGDSYSGALLGMANNIEIDNVAITDVLVEGKDYVGGLGGMLNVDKLMGTTVSGSIKGARYIGGVSGYINGFNIIESNISSTNVDGENDYIGGMFGAISSSNGTEAFANNSWLGTKVNGESYVGGLTGSAELNQIQLRNIQATGNVEGINKIGGIIGSCTGGILISTNYSGSIVATGSLVGGLVGEFYGYGAVNGVEDSYSVGSIEGLNSVGGLIGELGGGGEIKNAFSTSNVKGINAIGGLVGSNYSKITSSYYNGRTTGEALIGGLIGDNYGDIEKSYALGDVSGQNDIGGFVGGNYGIIQESFSKSNVTGTGSFIGGFAGKSYGTIENSYAKGNVEGSEFVGGFAGKSPTSITNSYSSGVIMGNSDVNGFIGGQGYGGEPDVFNVYYDADASGHQIPPENHGVALSTIGMKTDLDHYMGFDFTVVWGLNPLKNDGYPFLRWEGFLHSPPVLNNSNLSALSVNQGNLSLAFHRDVLDYTVNLDNSIDRIEITATPEEIYATVQIAGINVLNGQPTELTLIAGENHFPIEVTAIDGTNKEYRLTINRAAAHNEGTEENSGEEGSSGGSDSRGYYQASGKKEYKLEVYHLGEVVYSIVKDTDEFIIPNLISGISYNLKISKNGVIQEKQIIWSDEDQVDVRLNDRPTELFELKIEEGSTLYLENLFAHDNVEFESLTDYKDFDNGILTAKETGNVLILVSNEEVKILLNISIVKKEKDKISYSDFIKGRRLELLREYDQEKIDLIQLNGAITDGIVLPVDSVITRRGKVVFEDMPPIIVQGRTLLPIRAIAEGLGFIVSWDEEDMRVGIIKDSTYIEIYIGSTTAYVNGKAIEIDVPAEIMGGRTYLPLRFISEVLGHVILWENISMTADIIN